MGRSVSKYPFTIRSGRASKQPRGSGRGHRRANSVSGKAREGGDLAEPIVDRAQRRRGRKAPARPATQDRGGVSRKLRVFAGLWALAALPSPAPAQGPVITEFMAVNNRILADQDGDYSDWIEIFNLASSRVSLDGWYLTD